MLRGAFNKQSLVSPGASVNSSQTPNNNDEQEPSLGTRPAPLENGRTTLSLLDESHPDVEDGSSVAAGAPAAPVFYAGVMLRGHKADLVRLFELPPNERLNGDFHCAMRKRVLLQGRMYVFDNYVCFYSAVFGFAKKRRMPMRTIKAVRKKKHLGFPNSLEIETDEYKEFFTSFLSREEAYQLIMKLWDESKRRADAEDGCPLARSIDTGSFTGAPNGARELASPQSTGRGAPADGPRRAGTQSSAAAAASAGGRAGRSHAEPSLLTRNSGSMGDDGEEDEEEGGGMWAMEPRPAPPVAPGSRHVLHCTLPGTPRDFFDVVLADSAPFLEDFLDSQGNRRINLTSWKRHPQLGHVRDMNFTAPIKGAFGNWGVAHTACFQSQRFCLYAEDHIVFESSQTMTDIPYGDCFTVDQRWDIRRDQYADPDRPQVCFDLHVRVPFNSRCLFKGVIESGSVKQVQDTYSQFVEHLRPVLQERLASRNTLNLNLNLDVRDPSEPPLPAAALTPRLNSGTHAASRLNAAPMVRSLQSLPSMRQSYEPGDPVELNPLRQSMQHGPTLAARATTSGVAPGGEPSVWRLLVSLGGRLADGASGLLDAGIDVVLNLTQCRTTPQMRFLVALVILMFVANLVCMVAYLWPSSAATPAATPVVAPAAPAPSVAGPQAFPDLSALNLDLSALLGSAGAAAGADPVAAAGGGSTAGAASFWVQRVAALQHELLLLQGRLEIVSREVGMVVSHLTQAAAAAGAQVEAAVVEGAGAAAAAAAAGEL